MKKLFVFLLFVLFSGITLGQEKDTSTIYNEMCDNAKKLSLQGRFTPDLSDNNQVINNYPKVGIKVWFTDSFGNCYNPQKHRFNPKEKFNINIETAYAVKVCLFQNYNEDILESRLVYPLKEVPASYNALRPGVPVQIPIPFKMDDDMRDEIMSIVVARVDANLAEIQQNGNSGTTVVSTTGPNSPVIVNTGSGSAHSANNSTGTATTNSTGTASTNSTTTTVLGENDVITLRCFSERCNKEKAENKINTRFSADLTSTISVSGTTIAPNTNDDSCLILFGNSKIAQYQLTLHK